jgi:hypothetical protein
VIKSEGWAISTLDWETELKAVGVEVEEDGSESRSEEIAGYQVVRFGVDLFKTGRNGSMKPLLEDDNRGCDKAIGHNGDLAGRRMLLSKQEMS